MEEFEKKKKNEGARRVQRITAHRKYCCRQIAKKHNSMLKGNAYQLLKDTGFFVDTFMTDTLEGDVLPWLMNAAEKYASQIEEYESFPNDMIDGYFQKVTQIHKATVEGQHKKI